MKVLHRAEDFAAAPKVEKPTIYGRECFEREEEDSARVVPLYAGPPPASREEARAIADGENGKLRTVYENAAKHHNACVDDHAAAVNPAPADKPIS